MKPVRPKGNNVTTSEIRNGGQWPSRSSAKPSRRPARARSRRQRLAAGAVLASTTLLGTYIAAIRPQPTYASPNKGASSDSASLLPRARSMVAAQVVPTCAQADTTVRDETELRNAILASTDDSVICISGAIELNGELPSLDDTGLTLVGTSAQDDSIIGLGNHRILAGEFTAADDSTVTIANVGFANGSATTAVGSGSDVTGGALSLVGSSPSLVVYDAIFTGNEANGGSNGYGGAIYVAGDVEISGSSFRGNYAEIDGGAIAVKNGGVRIVDSTLEGNHAGDRGGAIHAYVDGNAESGYLGISGSTFTDDSAGFSGGAVFFESKYVDTQISISDSDFTGNRTTTLSASPSSAGGGAVYVFMYQDSNDTFSHDVDIAGGSTFTDNYSKGFGGAVRIRTNYVDSTIDVIDTTFTRNVAGANTGGALDLRENEDGTIDLNVSGNSTFTDNRAGADGGAIHARSIQPGGSVTANVSGIDFARNYAGDDGGAVYVGADSDGYIAIQGSTFQDDSAAYYGGAVSVSFDDTSTTKITGSTFDGHTALDGGGAVYVSVDYGSITIQDSHFANNDSANNGGAVYVYANQPSDVSVVGSSFTANSADSSGRSDGGALAIYGLYDIDATIGSSTFSRNRSDRNGGAAWVKADSAGGLHLVIDDSTTFDNNYSGRYGGALFTYGDGAANSVLIADATFTDDSASGDGGAVHVDLNNYPGTVTIERSTFTGHEAGDDGGALHVTVDDTVSLREVTIADSSAAGDFGGGLVLYYGAATITSSSFTGNIADFGGAIASFYGSLTVTNSFLGSNYARIGAGGIYAFSDLSLNFTTSYDDSSAGSLESIYIGSGYTLTAIASAVGSSVDDRVIGGPGSIDDSYSVSTGTTAVFTGPGSQLVTPGALGLQALDGTGPGKAGRSPSARSILVTAAPTSDLGTGVNVDQLDVTRGPTVGTDIWTIGSRQVSGSGPNPNPPTPTPTPAYPPSAPRDVTAVGGDGSAFVSWLVPSNPGSFPVSNYKVTAVPGGASCLTTTLSCTVSGLTNGTTYTFMVEALNGAGWSPASRASNPVTPGGVTPAPEPQAIPDPLAPGESVLLTNGVVDPNVTVDPNAEDNGLQIEGEEWTMDLDGLGPDGKPLNLGPDGVLRLESERDVATEGTGFLPNSSVDLYVDPPVMLSGASARETGKAIYVGTVRTDAQGSFAGTATLPRDIAPGDHVLQATGYSPGLQARAMSLGVVVEPSITLTPGKRSRDCRTDCKGDRHDRITATGVVAGLKEGTKLRAYVRYSGQSDFTKRKAVIRVKADGTFRWTSRQIKSSKAVTAYVAWRDVSSNEVYWARIR